MLIRWTGNGLTKINVFPWQLCKSQSYGIMWIKQAIFSYFWSIEKLRWTIVSILAKLFNAVTWNYPLNYLIYLIFSLVGSPSFFSSLETQRLSLSIITSLTPNRRSILEAIIEQKLFELKPPSKSKTFFFWPFDHGSQSVRNWGRRLFITFLRSVRNMKPDKNGTIW